ncbi:hypothetical protein CCM_06900 [Cordyceps militaris CM01]|uniref:Uncharacterized protein n=1 Tax=Cordyceps militaris (strain CM01) TaxID=983644 RepID=G3JLA6_CORMM|nr:uncharacterized protein CCM_06900 [Cordyceps militaris CM01]EGX90480.1 hypothetical protein CCM_06900 [Cordyceps militaris CM01]
MAIALPMTFGRFAALLGNYRSYILLLLCVAVTVIKRTTSNYASESSLQSVTLDTRTISAHVLGPMCPWTLVSCFLPPAHGATHLASIGQFFAAPSRKSLCRGLQAVLGVLSIK